jgi:hypothetical protein
MTWVIGLASPFGYGVAVSDVQVTFENGETLDCLQKVYAVAPNMVAGFSGSVKLGFALVDDLARVLRANLAPGEVVFPRRAAHFWHRRARRIFQRAPAALQRYGASVMLVGVSPTENLGDAPWARSYVVTMDSGEAFEPRYAAPDECVSIGSGNDVESYRQYVVHASKNPFPLMKMEQGLPGGMGGSLAMTAAVMIHREPRSGISKLLQRATVWRRRVEILPVNLGQPAEDGSGEVIFPALPELARSWPEFCTLVHRRGLSSASATARAHRLSGDELATLAASSGLGTG